MIKKLSKYALWFIGAMGLFLVIYSLTVIAYTPKIDPDKIYDHLPEASVLYDDKGEVIENLYLDNGNRRNIKYKDMPQDLIDAVVAIEDKTFWDHHGFNIIRIFGAIKDSIVTGEGISGTSTVTQQLARNVYLAESKSVRSLGRKISEAYYTVILEANLSKEQIMEAYLNTIYLGYNSYGIQSAAHAYFDKDPKELSLKECAALAALPKAPDAYALIKKIPANSNAQATQNADKKVLLETDEYTYVYNGDISENRRNLALKNMLANGKITEAELKEAEKEDLTKNLKVKLSSTLSGTSYFVDYMIEDIIKDLMEKYDYSVEDAKEKIYSGGLKIHTSLNTQAQAAVEKAFNNSANFPSVANLRYDSQSNVINSSGAVMLYKYSNYFNDEGTFTFKDDEFKISKEGNLVLRQGKRLNFYKTTVNNQLDVSVEFKDLYIVEDGAFKSIEGGVVLIPQQYKRLDKKGNLVIDKSLLKDYPNIISKSGNTYIINKTGYSLRAKVRQPQGAMVINDYKTGQIKAMIGGRETKGRLLYNRATNPRQPGSAIKPLAVYSSALQQGKNAADKGTPQHFVNYDKNQKTELYGRYWTAASSINDEELVVGGKVWPKNWYNDYRGIQSFRTSVEQSINVNAVRVFQQVGSSYAASQLEKFGVTSLVKEGAVNDMNASALALGGMTKGISPIEMAYAFGTFPNKGVRTEPISYTKIEDRNGKELLSTKVKKTRVIDGSIAYIMQDILRTTVTDGICGGAQVPGKVTCGKTGTTTDKKDIWFCGFTAQYSAALWIGNDVGIELTSGSNAATSLWRKVMTEATAGLGGSLPYQPGDVIRYGGELFAQGTQNGVIFSEEGKEEDKEKEDEELEDPTEDNPSTEPEVGPNIENPDGTTDPNGDGSGTGSGDGGTTGGGTVTPPAPPTP